jgi:hypothetical protein
LNRWQVEWFEFEYIIWCKNILCCSIIALPLPASSLGFSLPHVMVVVGQLWDVAFMMVGRGGRLLGQLI